MKKSPTKSSKSSRSLKILVPFDFLPETGFFLKPDLVKSIECHGAEIIPLLYDCSSLNSKIEEADALLIPGGVGDVDPELYSQSKKYDCVKVIRSRCDFEFQLLDKFLPTQKPLLAICWGHQLLNVFLGGSLIQDLRSERASKIQHVQSEPGHIPTHFVRITEESPAVDIFKSSSLHVNSTHHQAVDRLASSLICEGVSEDGLIECVRLDGHPFGWGVQWHPERLKDDLLIPRFLTQARQMK